MRIVILIIFGLFLTACQGTNPYGLTTASVGESVVSSASGQAGTGVTPIKGIKYVKMVIKFFTTNVSNIFFYNYFYYFINPNYCIIKKLCLKNFNK